MKVIFINTYPLYNKDIPVYYPGTDDFFKFGMGEFIAKEFYARNYSIKFENWRMDLRIDHLMEKEINGVTCRVFPSKIIKFFGEYSGIFLNRLKKEAKDPDVVFHFMGTHRINYHVFCYLARKRKCIATHLGGANPLWKYKKNGKILSLVYYLIEKYLLLKNYDHILSICRSEVEYYKTLKINVTHMPVFGISREEFFTIKNRIECRNKLGLPTDKKIILQVGRATQNRGFDWILKIIDHYSQFNEYFLVFVGIHKEDEYYAELKKRNVFMLDYMDEITLSDYYNSADILIFLLHNSMELNFGGTGYVPLEALACGTPIISSTFGSFPDPAILEVSRIPLQYAEVIPMIDELLFAEVPREKCRELVMKTFSWDSIVKKHYELYTSPVLI